MSQKEQRNNHSDLGGSNLSNVSSTSSLGSRRGLDTVESQSELELFGEFGSFDSPDQILSNPEYNHLIKS